MLKCDVLSKDIALSISEIVVHM